MSRVHCSWWQAEPRADGDRVTEALAGRHRAQSGEDRPGLGMVCGAGEQLARVELYYTHMHASSQYRLKLK